MKKTAVITGGSKGIGLGIAKKLAIDGFQIVIMGTTPAQENLEALEWFETKGFEVEYVQGNVADKEARERLMERTLQRFMRIDALVNNAGVAPQVRQNIIDMTEESYDRVMDINLKSAVFLSQLAARQMRKQEPIGESRGIIVNVGSMSSTVVSISRGEYCMAKAGMSMLTQLLATALADDAIYVYEVRPGIIETRTTAVVKDKYDAVCSSDELLIKRWGTPADVAQAVSMFCSGKLAYCTGQSISVDGGFTMRRL